jgi:glucosamine-6-phosphate deaminase
MGLEVIVCKDHDHIGVVSADILVPAMQKATITDQQTFRLGLATGNSPIPIYKKLCMRQSEFNAKLIDSINLDEYVGLPGKKPNDRQRHSESYFTFMQYKLFNLLNPPFKESHIPLGHMIDPLELEAELKKAGDAIKYLGTDKGRAIIIPDDVNNPFLRDLKRDYLDAYINPIKKHRVNYWIVGSGGKGHIAFHESGIPLNLDMLLVQLDENTRQNAVADGHFDRIVNSPKYALSVGAVGVATYSDNVILVANGDRKAGPIRDALLGEITPDVPISILQQFISYTDRTAYFIIDKIAAQHLVGKEQQAQLKSKGINFRYA